MNCPSCAHRLIEVDGILTCDNPECTLWFKEIEPGWRVHGSGPYAHISKTFWSGVYSGIYRANEACANHLHYLDTHRSGRGLPESQRLRMVIRHRVRVDGEWCQFLDGSLCPNADPAMGVW